MVTFAPMRSLFRGLSAVAALALTGAGCGPIEYISMVTFQASKAVATAKSLRADKLAPYEYTSAMEYLHKARELGGYSRYHQSVEFGEKARDMGRKAQEVARERAAPHAEAAPQ
jgi:hypothetical protein